MVLEPISPRSERLKEGGSTDDFESMTKSFLMKILFAGFGEKPDALLFIPTDDAKSLFSVIGFLSCWTAETRAAWNVSRVCFEQCRAVLRGLHEVWAKSFWTAATQQLHTYISYKLATLPSKQSPFQVYTEGPVLLVAGIA